MNDKIITKEEGNNLDNAVHYDYFKELGVDEKVDIEWAMAFISEQKILYGEVPSSAFINESWERNKEYFYSRKGKPFLTITK